MAIEAGGKNGIFPVDEKTIAYMKEHSTKDHIRFTRQTRMLSIRATYTIDLSSLKPTVSFPHLPENTHTIDEVGDIAIDQVVIGSCTNGRIEDLRAAAEILKGRKVKKGLRCIVIPATQADLSSGNRGRTCSNLHSGRSCCQHTDLWTMSWRIHGYSGCA